MQPLAPPSQVWLQASLCRLLTGTLMHRKQRPSLLKLLWASEQTGSPLPHQKLRISGATVLTAVFLCNLEDKRLETFLTSLTCFSLSMPLHPVVYIEAPRGRSAKGRRIAPFSLWRFPSLHILKFIKQGKRERGDSPLLPASPLFIHSMGTC